MSLEIRVATFNVSSAADLQNHFLDDPKSIAQELLSGSQLESEVAKLEALAAKLENASSRTITQDLTKGQLPPA